MWKGIHVLCFGVLIYFAVGSAFAQPQTYYVSLDGIDAPGRGSMESPFATIQYAVDLCWDQIYGDTVILFPGVYNQTVTTSGQFVNIRSFYWDQAFTESAQLTDITGIDDYPAFEIGESSRVTIEGIQIAYNYSYNGPAIRCYNSDLTIRHCDIMENTATGGPGGAIYCSDPETTLTIEDSSFSWNCSSDVGGAIYLTNVGTATITQCFFYGNWGDGNGQAIYNYNSGLVIDHCTFLNNPWSSSGASVIHVENNAQRPNIYKNSIIWNDDGPASITCDEGSPTVSYCCGTYYGGTGNFFANPRLDSTWSPHLLRRSPCINAGEPTGHAYERDIDGSNRVQQGRLDIGIDETPYNTSLFCLYVDIQTASPNNDGFSWSQPFKYLQDALIYSRQHSEIEEIWVADGTYYPDVWKDNTATNGNNRQEESFSLVNKVKLYGGFQGVSTEFPSGEWRLDQRSDTISSYPSILSGDIAQDDQPTQIVGSNSFNVVSALGVDANSIVDRFTIKGGDANGTLGYSDGGGMVNNNASPGVFDCLFTLNRAAQKGGAMFNNVSRSILNGCTFSGNQAKFGGAIYNYAQSDIYALNCDFVSNIAENGGAVFNHTQSHPQMIRCVIRDNTATNTAQTGLGGGMVNTAQSTVDVVNNIFCNNTSDAPGGAIYAHYYSPVLLTNCTVTLNTVTYNTVGGGLNITGTDSLSTVINSILWNNDGSTALSSQINNISYAAISYSSVNSIPSENNNISSDPLFVNGTNPSINRSHSDGLYLQATSPCLNNGNNSVVDWSGDIAGYKRIESTTVDRGAYERGYTPEPQPSVIIMVWTNEVNSGNLTYAVNDFNNDLLNYRSLVASLNGVDLQAITKCLVPPDPMNIGYDFDFPGDDVVPMNGVYPYDIIGISNFRGSDATLSDFTTEFANLTSWKKVEYVILCIDSSDSMAPWYYRPVLNSFKQYLQSQGIIYYLNHYGDERWIKAINDVLADPENYVE